MNNALLRVEGVTGDPPDPWEKPNSQMDFWVYELQDGLPLSTWITCALSAIQTLGQQLGDFRARGYALYLFIETNSAAQPVVFTPDILSALAKHDIVLEVSNDAWCDQED